MPSKKEAQVHLRDKIYGSEMLTIFHSFYVSDILFGGRPATPYP